MAGKILITGATGRVGSAIIEQMRSDDRVVAGVRDIDRARQTFGDDLVYVPLDFADTRTFEPALADVERVFLMWAQVAIEQVMQFIEVAEQAGVTHIVFLSIFKADELRVVPHRLIEERLEASPVAHTFLRASYFMQNLSSIHRADIAGYHQIFIPAGNGRTSFIDVRDVAAVAVKALTEDGHANIAYSLTGSESLTYAEFAAIMSETLDTCIYYTDANPVDFVVRMMQTHGYPAGLALFMIVEYSAARFGLAGETSPQLRELLDREPISVAQFVDDYRRVWGY